MPFVATLHKATADDMRRTRTGGHPCSWLGLDSSARELMCSWSGSVLDRLSDLLTARHA
jgi:hypothetical protein